MNRKVQKNSTYEIDFFCNIKTVTFDPFNAFSFYKVHFMFIIQSLIKSFFYGSWISLKIWDQPAVSLVHHFEDIWAPHCQCDEESFVERSIFRNSGNTVWFVSALRESDYYMVSLNDLSLRVIFLSLFDQHALRSQSL